MITILRIGHRPSRDKRITTHVALAARAFGADRIIVDTKDDSLEDTVNSVSRRFGGDFRISTGIKWRKFLEQENSVKVHLTMYGIPVQECVKSIRSEFQIKGSITIVVGAGKVPSDLYEISDYNVAVLNQPHSEVSATALFLDRLKSGEELLTRFTGEMLIHPSERGKLVTSNESDTSMSGRKRKD